MKLPLFPLLAGIISLAVLGCAKKPVNQPDRSFEASPIFKNAMNLVHDKELPREKNPLLARSLQDLYSLKGCVGVGYDDSPESATKKAASAYRESGCQSGEPAKTVRFRAYNGSFYCIMTTNALAYEIKLEEKKP
jgi:hypothetical protein